MRLETSLSKLVGDSENNPVQTRAQCVCGSVLLLLFYQQHQRDKGDNARILSHKIKRSFLDKLSHPLQTTLFEPQTVNISYVRVPKPWMMFP